MIGFILTIAIILSFLAVSYENEFWSYRGDGSVSKEPIQDVAEGRGEPSGGSTTKGFAHAMPLGKVTYNGGPEAEEAGEEDKLGGHGLQPNSVGQPKVDAPEDTARDVDEDPAVDTIEGFDDDDDDDDSDGESEDAPDSEAADTEEKVKLEDPKAPVSVATKPPPPKTYLPERQPKTPRKSLENPLDAAPKPAAPAATAPSSSTPAKAKPQVDSDTNDSSSEKPSAEASNNDAYRTESGYGYVSTRRSKAKSFMVVFMGHSGSTAFTTELRTHTQFEVERLEPLEHGEYSGNTELALQRARELMDRGIGKGKIPGFKIRPFHIQNRPEAWRKFTAEYDTRIIWQYRENILKQAVGEYRHRFLNDSSVVEGLSRKQKPCEKGSDQKCRIRIDNMRGLHGLMNDFSGSDELLSAAARALHRDEDMMVVRYEDYLYYRERTMREAFDFFGVDFEDTAPQRLKASPDNLCEMVSNFQELCDHFLPCQLWRPYLHDSVNNCRCKPGGWNSFDSTYCRRAAWYQSKD